MVIDLRSDTVTRPTEPMRRAMVNAVVGDDQKGEDPTVAALEERTATLLGHEAAVFLPTASMANQIGLKLLGEPGDGLLAERLSHVLVYELGGPAVHSGLVASPIDGRDGQFTEDELDRLVVPAAWDRSGTTVLSIENTHAEAGGRAWDPELLHRVIGRARARGLRLHLDGARLMNATAATGTDPAGLAGAFDTVTFCLSKGLGCPVGALLATSARSAAHARRLRLRFGGAMRQAGILAAAGLYALDHHVTRIADDHAHARLLAELVCGRLGLPPVQVETNIVLFDITSTGRSTDAVITDLRAEGVLLSTTTKPGVLRAVTHLDVTEHDVRRAADRIVESLARGSPARERAHPGEVRQ